jgi:hypothetical protein
METTMTEEHDLYLLLLKRIGASGDVIEAARNARTAQNYVEARPDQVARVWSHVEAPEAAPY